MLTTSAFAGMAALVGDQARAAMLTALMDGRALTASELARVAGIAPQTASGHLARMTEGGLLTLERQGRHRYFRLSSPAVAQMLESIMGVAARVEGAVRPAVRTGPSDRSMRLARTCYDHLAGSLAVGIADSLQSAGHLVLSSDGGILTGSGLEFLSGLGVRLPPITTARQKARVFCKPCMDWSERRPHIAGTVGAALCRACFDKGWVRSMAGTRAVAVTPMGQRALTDAFGIRLEPAALPAIPSAAARTVRRSLEATPNGEAA